MQLFRRRWEDSQSANLKGLLDVHVRTVCPGVWFITARGSLVFSTFESTMLNPTGSCDRANANHKKKKGLKMVPDDFPRHASWLEMSASLWVSLYKIPAGGTFSPSLPPPPSLYSDSQARFQVHHSNNLHPLLPNTKKCHSDHRVQPLLNYDLILMTDGFVWHVTPVGLQDHAGRQSNLKPDELVTSSNLSFQLIMQSKAPEQ